MAMAAAAAIVIGIMVSGAFEVHRQRAGTGSADSGEQLDLPASVEWESSYSKDGVMLQWEQTENADGYEIARAKKEDGPFEVIATIDAAQDVSYAVGEDTGSGNDDTQDVTYYVDEDVKAGRTYWYQMRAFCEQDGERQFGEASVGEQETRNMKQLKKRLSEMLDGYDGTWAVYVECLDTEESCSIHNQQIYAASMIKPFVMVSLYDKVKNGELEKSDEMDDLVEQMITVSSNDAYNSLVTWQSGTGSFLDGCAVVNQYLAEHGYDDTKVVHTLRPSNSSFITLGGDNVTTVEDCGKLLKHIYDGANRGKKLDKKMLRFLKGQDNRSKIPAGVPDDVETANKTGETDSCEHDMAIVYGPEHTYILCVMSQYASDAVGRITEISHEVYQYLN